MEPHHHSDEQSEAEQAAVPSVPETEAYAETENARAGLCALCYERDKDLSQSGYSVLCDECRQQKLKLYIPPTIKMFLVAVCALFLFSILMFVPVLSAYKDYLAAEKHMQAREFSFAYDKYRAVLEKYDFSVPLALKATEAAMSAQDFDAMLDVFDTYLVGKSLNDKDYAQALAYSDFLDFILATDQEINELYAESTELDDPAEQIPFLCKGFEALLLKADIDKTRVYYYLGLIAEDTAQALQYIKLSAEQDTRFTYPLSDYGKLLRRAGDFEQAEQVYQKAIALNACDALSWQGLGVLELLKGQKSLALEHIRYADQLEPDDVYIVETLVIALYENGLRDEAAVFLERLFSIDEDLEGYLNGTISLEQYYLDSTSSET